MAKATGRKAPAAQKVTSAKVVAKKAAPAAKKPPAKAAARKNAPAKKKLPVKQSAAKKAATTKPVAKKKPAPAKSGVKAAVKKTAVKKTAVKKTAAKKTAAKKTAVKKPVAKKAATAATKAAKATKSTKASAAKTTKAAKAVKAPVVKAAPVKKQPAGRTCALSGIFVPKQSANISPKTLIRLREILDEERERHVRQAEDLQADADALVDQREQGDTQFDEESGEGDTISVERERDLMMSATARQAVEEIDRALERITAGTYGLCSPAGRRIPVARLEAIPWAETCVDCKQRVERRR